MAELDFDPFDCEAFPGLEFFFSGDRDMLTLNAFESAHDRKVPLLSLERRGYVVRHRVPGDFAPIPPADEGRIPLEGQPNQVPRPARDAPRIRPIAAAPAPRPEPSRTPDLPFAQTHLRLRREENPFADPGEQQSIRLEAKIDGHWHAITIINPNTGRLTRTYFDRWYYTRVRAAGFCISRDGGIAVSNPQERARARAALPPEDLEAEVPDLAIPPGPFSDRILAFRDRLAQFGAFLDANRDLHNEIARATTRARITDHFGNVDAWDRFFVRATTAYDSLRTHLATEADRPAPQWVLLHYRWNERDDAWKLHGAVEDGQRVPDHAPTVIPELPVSRGDGGPGGRYHATRGLPQGWNRHAWFNLQTCEMARDDGTGRPPAPTLIPPALQQGGGEGGVLADAIEAVQEGIAFGGGGQFEGFMALAVGDCGPHHQGQMTADIRLEINRLWADHNLVPNLPQGVIATIATFRKYNRIGDPAVWCELNEANGLFTGTYRNRVMHDTLPVRRADVPEGPGEEKCRVLKLTDPTTGNYYIATLTAALNRTITDLLVAAEMELDGDDDEEYADDPEPDDDF